MTQLEKMKDLPAFERRKEKIQYAMLENKKRAFRDQKETVRLPHVTLLENWKRKLLAEKKKDEEGFRDFMEKTAEGFRERDERAHKLATEPNDAFKAVLINARAQVGQPDPLAGRTEEERRQFVQIRIFYEKTSSPLGDVSAESLNNWIQKEKRRRAEGEGRVTRARRRLGEAAINVPAAVREEEDMIEVLQNVVVIAPEIGVPLDPEVDIVEQLEAPNRRRSRRFHAAVEPVENEEPPVQRARIYEEEAVEAVGAQEQELHGELSAKLEEEPSTSDSGDRKPEQPDPRIQAVESPMIGRRSLSSPQSPMAVDEPSTSADFSADNKLMSRLRESLSALVLGSPDPEASHMAGEEDEREAEEQEDDSEEMEVDQDDEEEEAEEAAPSEAPKRSMRKNPAQTARFKDYMASKNPMKQLQPVQAFQQPGPSQPAHNDNQRPARKKMIPKNLEDFVLF